MHRENVFFFVLFLLFHSVQNFFCVTKRIWFLYEIYFIIYITVDNTSLQKSTFFNPISRNQTLLAIMHRISDPFSQSGLDFEIFGKNFFLLKPNNELLRSYFSSNYIFQFIPPILCLIKKKSQIFILRSKFHAEKMVYGWSGFSCKLM